MKKVSIKLIASLIVVIAWGSYYLKFGNWFDFSNDTSVWGQFGDFLGGVINPLLTFISVLYLINSVNLQREANESLIALEEFKKTETKFYNMLESQRSSFDSLKIIEHRDGKSIEYKGGEAVSYLEVLIIDMIDKGKSKADVQGAIRDADPADNIFSMARRFSNIINLIDREFQGSQKNEYYDTLLNMTEFKQICLLAIMLELFDWPIVKVIDESNILNSESLNDYRRSFRVE